MKTLEDILQELGSKKPFLKKVRIDEEGHKQPFTISGSKAYSKLTDILYAVGELVGEDMNDIIEELDDICNKEY